MLHKKLNTFSYFYAVFQYMGELGASFEVYRNDELTVEDVKRYYHNRYFISLRISIYHEIIVFWGIRGSMLTYFNYFTDLQIYRKNPRGILISPGPGECFL